MLKDLDVNGIYLKTIFDGYDFIHSEVGQTLISPNKFNIIYHTTYMEQIYDKASDFIEYCKYEEDGYLPHNLMIKYHCGYYSLNNANDNKNPWKDKTYILFNSRMLQSIFKKVSDIDKNIGFWVCPAYNEYNEIEAIGFRVKNKEDVLGAFKWLFTCGNNIIYGKNTVDKNKSCYIVEGYRDYIALNESGINCIGLGSVTISKKQQEYINTLKQPILLFDNDHFGLKKTMDYKNNYNFETAILIGTEEKDAWDAYCKGELSICRVK